MVLKQTLLISKLLECIQFRFQKKNMILFFRQFLVCYLMLLKFNSDATYYDSKNSSVVFVRI